MGGGGRQEPVSPGPPCGVGEPQSRTVACFRLMAVQFVVLLLGQQTSVDGRAFSSSVAVMSCHAPGFRCGSRIPGQKGGWGAVGPVSTIACKPLSGPLFSRSAALPNQCLLCVPELPTSGDGDDPRAHVSRTILPARFPRCQQRGCVGRAGLYVVATMNKEDVVVVRVPFSSL